MSKPVLFIVTADDCPACTGFKKMYSDIESSIRSKDLVEIRYIPLATRSSARTNPEPAMSIVTHFPFLSLLSRGQWNDLQAKKKISSTVVFGKGGKHYPLNKDGINMWISDNIGSLGGSNSNNYQSIVTSIPKSTSSVSSNNNIGRYNPRKYNTNW